MDLESEKSLFCASLVHNLMLRRINEPNAIEDELWFAIRRTKARFLKREFYLVTRLKFGALSTLIVNPYEALPGGIHLQYWGPGNEVKIQHILEMFKGGQFQQEGDTTKMALVLMATNVLFGQDYRRSVVPCAAEVPDSPLAALHVVLHVVTTVTLQAAPLSASAAAPHAQARSPSLHLQMTMSIKRELQQMKTQWKKDLQSLQTDMQMQMHGQSMGEEDGARDKKGSGIGVDLDDAEAAQHSQRTPSLEALPPSEVEEAPHPASSRATTSSHSAPVPTPTETPPSPPPPPPRMVRSHLLLRLHLELRQKMHL
ncbi:Uncharacterized protein TCM_003399 [Theobroma cacao]|uniref:Uncharacterized protein n=1 Tax=Theobroma cacao TaxID=3641 RepID=A0A061DPZ4_THECC|nr:Uncharacterized protein TCM_003399 [Theobroma cacao]